MRNLQKLVAYKNFSFHSILGKVIWCDWFIAGLGRWSQDYDQQFPPTKPSNTYGYACYIATGIFHHAGSQILQLDGAFQILQLDGAFIGIQSQHYKWTLLIIQEWWAAGQGQQFDWPSKEVQHISLLNPMFQLTQRPWQAVEIFSSASSCAAFKIAYHTHCEQSTAEISHMTCRMPANELHGKLARNQCASTSARS